MHEIQENVINMARVISFVAKNRPHAHHKTHLHTMKIYNTRPVNLPSKLEISKT